MNEKPVSNEPRQTEMVQVRSLLNAIYLRYGLDFRNYADTSITRRIQKVVRAENLIDIAQLERRLIVDPACMERFLATATVNVTSMFRDPDFYRVLRNDVLPHIKTRPFTRIWHAGCSTGEEVISLAILLREAGLERRCRIYATDVNAEVLERAKQGVFPLPLLREYSKNYIAAGGREPFSDYYVARYDRVLFDRRLRSNVVYSQHNLASDGPFNLFDLILCRNVMIYFKRELSDRVHRLLYESLMPSGLLCLGTSEVIQFTPHESSYRPFHAEQRIYQKLL